MSNRAQSAKTPPNFALEQEQQQRSKSVPLNDFETGKPIQLNDDRQSISKFDPEIEEISGEEARELDLIAQYKKI